MGQTRGSAELGRELGDIGGPLIVAGVASASTLAFGYAALALLPGGACCSHWRDASSAWRIHDHRAPERNVRRGLAAMGRAAACMWCSTSTGQPPIGCRPPIGEPCRSIGRRVIRSGVLVTDRSPIPVGPEPPAES